MALSPTLSSLLCLYSWFAFRISKLIKTLFIVIGASETLWASRRHCATGQPNVRNSPILDYAHPLDYSTHRRRRTCRTALRQLAERCEFESITPNQILRDKLEFRIRVSKGRERLLRKNNLSLKKTDEVCRSHETMVQQTKVVGDVGLSVAGAGTMNAVSREAKRGRRGRGSRNTGARENNIVMHFSDVSIV